MSDKKKLLLLEDLTVPGNQYNSQGMDGGGQGQKPRKVNLVDLIDYQKKLDDDMSMAPNAMPYPLTTNVVEQIGDIYVQAVTVQTTLSQSYQSPLISDNKEATDSVKSIYKKLQQIKLIVKSVTEDLKKLDISG